MILKKFSFLICLVAILILTGCGKSGNQVTCTMSQDQSGMSMKQTVKMSFKDSNVDSASISMDVKLDDAYKSYKSILISSVKSEFSSLEEQYNVKINVKETSNGFNVNLTLNKDAMVSMFGSDLSGTKDQAVKYFESEGYTCK